MIAVTHPGKIGDLLYVLPTVWSLSIKHNTQVDFYTSEYCRPILPVLQYQGAIAEVHIPSCYKIRDHGQGVQPWEMPVCYNGYEIVYQLGVRNHPSKSFVLFYAEIAGVAPMEFRITAPEPKWDYDFPMSEVVLVATCRRTGNLYAKAAVDALRDNYPIIQLGAPGEALFDGVINMMQPDFLTTASYMARARAYAGATGANSVMCEAFPNLPSVVAYPQVVDDRHFLYSPNVKFMKDPTIDQYIGAIKERL